MHAPPSPIDTLEQMLREEEPNLLRLYLNPHLAQACLCLDRYVRTTWPGGPNAGEDHQSFLANGAEEALGGAIKLVRYNREAAPAAGGAGPVALVFDVAGRLAGFADEALAGGDRVEFLPGLRVVGAGEMGDADGPGWLRDLERSGAAIDPVVLVVGAEGVPDRAGALIRRVVGRRGASVVTCVDRAGLAAIRRGAGGVAGELAPDVVVFDESFADRGVPFSAFTARRPLFAAWNRPGKSTFHSTTFQPNTISTRHFMATLAAADPEFHGRHAAELEAIGRDVGRRGDAFRRFYQPSLHRLIRASGFETADVRASGSTVVVDGRPILDFVGGVACSVRGHNPPGYVDELRGAPAPGEGGVEAELSRRFRELTGLGVVLPAVTGAGAVENALRIALVARFPRRHVLALKAGFGGKTLLSLTGTANPSYKEKIGPLHAEVLYVDPFAADARERVDELLDRHDFAAVQVELIQSVGGVRRLPESLVRHLDEARARRGYLLIVDEVQTGMYRTGPFGQSETFGLTPDLMLLGKGTSDMMFPFSLTLASDPVARALADRGSTLIEAIRRRFGYEIGYKTVLNVLRLGEGRALTDQVAAAAGQVERALREGLAPIRSVREVRAFGLLIAVELDASSWLRRRFRKRLSAPYLLAMLRHESAPVFAGFCQYEPNTLKITPPLNVRPEEVERACRTIVEVLGRPFHRVLFAALGRLLGPARTTRKGKS